MRLVKFPPRLVYKINALVSNYEDNIIPLQAQKLNQLLVTAILRPIQTLLTVSTTFIAGR